jgi:hypothetical protein
VALACATGRGPTPFEPTPKREGLRAPWDPPSDVGGRDGSGGSVA